MNADKIETIAKRERDSILLYFYQDWHNEKEKSDYLLEELIIMYNLGCNHKFNENENKED